MKKLLITGGAGFIGSNFTRYWRKKYKSDTIIILDSITYAGNIDNLLGVENIKLVKGDIRDRSLVEYLIESYKIDTIVHFAAESHVDRSIDGPSAFIDTNILGTHELLRAARNSWLSKDGSKPHRFHHVSTDEVYGTLGPNDPAFSESTPYAPNSPYAATKAASDHLVRAYHHTYGLEITTSNCSNNYGPYQYPEKLIPLFFINALRGLSLPIYGDGQQIRDWLYVDDHCRGIELILNDGKVGEVYNIGGGAELANLSVIDTLCSTVDRTFQVNPALALRFPSAPAANGKPTSSLKTTVADRPGHDRRYAIDAAKITLELGYAPQHSFEDHFSNTLKWYIENEDWWSPLLK